ncbi:MAG: DUF998 domain-containing protein [Promethearchaeota archaeon]
MKRTKIPKSIISKWPISCIVGIIIIGLTWGLTIISIILAPPLFSPLKNYMSSLGNSSYNPNGATIYNSSVIISGLLFIVFFIGLYQWQDNKKSNKTLLYATQIVGFLLSITIILTGIYSEDFQTQHIFWSIIAGIMGFLVNVFIAYYLFRQKESIAKMNYSIFGLMGFYIIMLFILSPQHVLTEWIVRISGDINLILMIFNLKHVFRVRFLTHQN